MYFLDRKWSYFKKTADSLDYSGKLNFSVSSTFKSKCCTISFSFVNILVGTFKSFVLVSRSEYSRSRYDLVTSWYNRVSTTLMRVLSTLRKNLWRTKNPLGINLCKNTKQDCLRELDLRDFLIYNSFETSPKSLEFHVGTRPILLSYKLMVDWNHSYGQCCKNVSLLSRQNTRDDQRDRRNLIHKTRIFKGIKSLNLEF